MAVGAARLSGPARCGQPAGLAVQIAHHKVIDHARARARRPVPTEALPEPPSRAPAPAERDDELWGRVRRLPAKQRTAVALRFVLDCAYAEIGCAMGTSEDAAVATCMKGSHD